ncbi:MAG: hypothetical protein QXY36_03850 [Sulfolobales archaeon]
MGKVGLKLPIIAAISIAIVALSMATIVTYAKPNNGLGYVALIGAEEVSKGWGLGLQKMLKYQRILPPGIGLGLSVKSPFELSEEFKNKVLKILEANETTKNLLDQGYNITVIRPIIKLVVQGDGSIMLKVAEVRVDLYKKGEGVVHVIVDYYKGEVINILYGLKIRECKCVTTTS